MDIKTIELNKFERELLEALVGKFLKTYEGKVDPEMVKKIEELQEKLK